MAFRDLAVLAALWARFQLDYDFAAMTEIEGKWIVQGDGADKKTQKAREEALVWYEAHHHDPTFLRNLAPDMAAIWGLKSLRSAGYHVTIASDRDARLTEVSKEWLAHWEIEYDDITIGNGQKLKHAREASQIWPVAFFDDNPKRAADLPGPGVTVFLLDRPWNAEVVSGKVNGGEVIRVKKWPEALALLPALKPDTVIKLRVPEFAKAVIIPASEQAWEIQQGTPEAEVAKQVEVSTGAMVALMIPAEAMPDVEQSESLHITMVFLGQANDVRNYLPAVQDAVRQVALRTPRLSGRIGGAGRFHNPDEPVIALPDVIGLDKLRADLVAALTAAGVSFPQDHGFSPHVTVQYAGPPVQVPSASLHFSTLTLMVGGERYDFPLSGVAYKHSEAQPDHLHDIRAALVSVLSDEPADVDYGQIWWNAEQAKAVVTIGDANENGPDIRAKLLAVPGVKDVEIADEWLPSEAEGWRELGRIGGVAKDFSVGSPIASGIAPFNLQGQTSPDGQGGAGIPAGARRKKPKKKRDLIGELRDGRIVVANDATRPVAAAKSVTPAQLPGKALRAAGLVVQAQDTGRVLMVQRKFDPGPDAPGKAGAWEFPGGRLEGDELPIYGGKREWEEETGQKLPPGKLINSWTSPDGVYTGFVWLIDRESRIKIDASRVDHDELANIAWFEPKDVEDMPAARGKVRDNTPWSALLAEKAATGAQACGAVGANQPQGDAPALVHNTKPLQKVSSGWNEDLHPRVGGKFVSAGNEHGRTVVDHALQGKVMGQVRSAGTHAQVLSGLKAAGLTEHAAHYQAVLSKVKADQQAGKVLNTLPHPREVFEKANVAVHAGTPVGGPYIATKFDMGAKVGAQGKTTGEGKTLVGGKTPGEIKAQAQEFRTYAKGLSTQDEFHQAIGGQSGKPQGAINASSTEILHGLQLSTATAAGIKELQSGGHINAQEAHIALGGHVNPASAYNHVMSGAITNAQFEQVTGQSASSYVAGGPHAGLGHPAGSSQQPIGPSVPTHVYTGGVSGGEAKYGLQLQSEPPAYVQGLHAQGAIGDAELHIGLGGKIDPSVASALYNNGHLTAGQTSTLIHGSLTAGASQPTGNAWEAHSPFGPKPVGEQQFTAKTSLEFQTKTGDQQRVRDAGNAHIAGLSQKEQATVTKYTGSWAEAVNKELRGHAVSASTQGQVEHADSALRTTRIDENTTTWRRIGGNEVGKIMSAGAGGHYTDHGFVSTSLTSQFDLAKSGDISVKIEIPAGSPGLYVSSISAVGKQEDELLLPRDSEFEIVRTGTGKDEGASVLRYVGSPRADSKPDIAGSLTKVSTQVPVSGESHLDGTAHDMMALSAGAKVIDGPHGSQPGTWYQRPDGSQFYAKPMEASRAYNEVGANLAYQILGGAKPGTDIPYVAVAKSPGSAYVVSEKIEGLTPKTGNEWSLATGGSKNETARADAARMFGVDALLSHWDTVGLEHDNLVIGPGGNAVRIDTGGAMGYRAQGGTKANWDTKPLGGSGWNEAWTLRGKSGPYGDTGHPGSQAKNVFGHLTDAQVASQLTELRQRVEDTQLFKQLDKAWASIGMPKATRDSNLAVLQARVDSIPAVVQRLKG